MIKAGATLFLQNFAQIVNDIISNLEKDGRIKSPLHKEVLKFESTAIIFWFFRFQDLFGEPLQRLTLDEMHQQYFSHLKKNGYSGEHAQTICDDLNLRYRTYDKFTDGADDFVKVGTNFANFVSERSKTDWDATEVMIPIELIKLATAKFKEFREVMK